MAHTDDSDMSTNTGTKQMRTSVTTFAGVQSFVVALISPWPEWFSLPQIANDEKSLIAAGIFVLISCTDWLDGRR